MIIDPEVPATKIKADAPSDGRDLRADERREFQRGYKSFALDYYMVCTGKLAALDIDDDRFQLIKELNNQIESWRNSQIQGAHDASTSFSSF